MECTALHGCLEAEIKRLSECVDIDSRIISHYQLMEQHYIGRPLFYKSILKHDRFLVVLSMLAHYYSDPFPSLSRVKEFCERRGYLSKNSLESYFSYFLISGYMDVSDHPEDRRLRVFKPSVRAMSKTVKILSAYLFPAMGARASECLGSRADDKVVRAYFKGLNTLLEANLVLDNLVPECRWLVNRDGGHMLMLAFFNDALQGERTTSGSYKVSTYAQLSSRLAVSSTHLIRLVKEGEKKGYFKACKSGLEITECFMVLVRKMMLVNFAITLVSIRIGEG